jgi:hypothetical protein
MLLQAARPAAPDLETLAPQAQTAQLPVEFRLARAERGLHLATQAPVRPVPSQWALQSGQCSTHPVDSRARASEVERALPAGLAIRQAPVRAQPPAPIPPPRGDHGPLPGEQPCAGRDQRQGPARLFVNNLAIFQDTPCLQGPLLDSRPVLRNARFHHAPRPHEKSKARISHAGGMGSFPAPRGRRAGKGREKGQAHLLGSLGRHSRQWVPHIPQYVALRRFSYRDGFWGG